MPYRKSAVFAAMVVFVISLALTAMATEESVSEGSEVKIRYTLTVDGEVVDESPEDSPLQFRVGDGRLIPGFENAVMGMEEGERKSFTVEPEEGYGAVDPEAFRTVPRDQLPPEIDPEVGMVLSAQGPNGQIIPLRITEVNDESVVVDLNHPLAGKTLDFDVEVVEIQ